MLTELIGIGITGLLGAGVTLLVIRASNRSLPKWLILLGAAVAMIGFALSSDYRWFSRTSAALPMELRLAQTVETTSIWRPWSFVQPVTDRFNAVDMRKIRPDREEEGLVTIDLVLFGRWQPVRVVQMMVHCQLRQRADPVLGSAAEPVLLEVPDDDPIVSAVCGAAR